MVKEIGLKHIPSAAGGMARVASFAYGPRIMFEAEGGSGGGGNDDAAKAAAAAAAAEAAKTAAATAATEAAKVAADKAAADAEKARLSGLSDKEAELLKDVMSKKKKLEAADAANADLTAKLKAFDGLDVTMIRKMLDDQKTAEKAAAEKAGDFERVKKMMAEESDKAIALAKKEAADSKALLQASNSKIGDLTIGAAFNSSEFVSKELILPASKARSVFGDHFEIEGDHVVGYDKPKGGAERTKLVDAAGSPLAFDEAIKRIVAADADSDRLLKSKLATGAQSRTDNTTRIIKTEGPDGLKGASRILAILEAKKAAKK